MESPIDKYKAVLKEAERVTSETRGMKVTSTMLRNLTLLGVTDKQLVLRTKKVYLLRSMLNRKSKILKGINMVAPEVESIMIIYAEDEN